MKRRRRAARTSSAFEGINITPFTDVLLVLLIIFMIAGSSLAPTGLGLTGLAQASSESVETEALLGLIVEIGPDGAAKLLIGAQETNWQRLRDLPASTRVSLSIDATTTSEQVIRHYDRLLLLGFKDIEWAPPRQAEP